jgi:hypothetical protein
VERIQKILSQIELFNEPKKILVLDFWSESEEARGNQTPLLQQLGEVLTSLRSGVVLQKILCTEESILRLPRSLLGQDFEGVVLLLPLQQDHGTRAIHASISKRITQLARCNTDQVSLFTAEGQPDQEDPELAAFWLNIPTLVIKQQSLEAMILSVVISAVPKGTPVIVISSQRLLSSYASNALRTIMHQQGTVKYVIDLGGEWPGTHRQFNLSSVAMICGLSDTPIVRFFKCPAPSEAALEEVIKDFQHLCRRQGGTTKYGYVLRNGLPLSDSWLIEAHHPRWEQYLENLRSIGGVCSLTDFGRLTAPPPMFEHIASSQTEWPVVSGRQILADGSFDEEVFHEEGPGPGPRYWQGSPPPDNVHLIPGDVCLSRFFPDNLQGTGLRFATIPDTESNWCLGQNMIRFRFNPTVPVSVQNFVLTYLRSPEAADWLRSRSGGIHINLHLLEELPVPKPDDSTLAALDRLVAARRMFEEWAHQLSDLQRRVFTFSSLQETRKELLEVSARAEQRLAAAIAAETLAWRVRNLYPHPLAFRYRTAELLPVGIEKYLAVLEAGEACLAYLALMGCVFCEAANPRLSIAYVSEMIGRLRQRPDSGVSMGDWIAVVKELNTGRHFKSLGAMDPFFEVCSFLDDNPDLEAAIRGLKTKRDNFAHNRRPHEAELDTKIDEAERELDVLYAHADFVTRYPLREVLYVQPLGRQLRGTYNCADLIGDHPIAGVKTAEYKGSPPSIGLHIIDQHGHPHLAEPWLVRKHCERCKFPETYIVDRYMRDGRILYKSLERGHEEDMSPLRDDLKQVGVDLP